MRKAIILVAMLTSVTFSTASSADDLTDRINSAIQIKLSIPILVSAPTGKERSFDGTEQAQKDFVKQVNVILEKGETLAQTVAEVRHLPVDKVVYVNPHEWGVAGPSQNKNEHSGLPEKQFVTVQAVASNVTSANINSNYVLRFSPSIEASDARAIMSRYYKVVVPELNKLSQQFFDTNFPPAMEAAEKQRKEAEDSVSNSEANRQSLQYRSYQLLPYEKVSEHMADLQRQQLAIRLSLAGMKAREKALHEQIDVAQARLREQTEQSKKEASNDDLIRSLSDLVKLRMEQAAKTRQSSQAGVATQAEASDADAKVLEAKIELYSAQAKKQPHLNSDQLDSLNTELTKLAIDQAEAEARLKFLEDVNHEVTDRIERRVQLDQEIKRVDGEIESQKGKLARATERVKELENVKANFRPIELKSNDN